MISDEWLAAAKDLLRLPLVEVRWLDARASNGDDWAVANRNRRGCMKALVSVPFPPETIDGWRIAWRRQDYVALGGSAATIIAFFAQKRKRMLRNSVRIVWAEDAPPSIEQIATVRSALLLVLRGRIAGRARA